MNLIYISSVCSEKRYKKAIKSGLTTRGYQNQKFHHLILEGICQFEDVKVDVASYPPFDYGRTYVRGTSEKEGRVHYHYPGLIMIPYIKRICIYINTFFKVLRLSKKDSIIICNVMDTFMSFAAQRVARIRRLKTIGIVTDVPAYTQSVPGRGIKHKLDDIFQSIGLNYCRRHDGYLLLADAMNKLVNPNNKPSIVIEGFADAGMESKSNKLVEKRYPKVLMYAGGISKQYGLELLVKAFLKIGNPEWVLNIYGRGDYVEELKEVSNNHKNVQYMGLVENETIVKEQIAATLLVNPRPTHEEFVKYSFPSKTIESMASGTPLLTTRLPSMPENYHNYVYLFDEENEESFSRVLSSTMEKPVEELHNFGMTAKQFIIQNKNNKVQTKRFIDFVKNHILS